MAEYLRVEKPFLDKLRQLHWQVIDQGQGIPSDPTRSLRSDFKQVILEKTFRDSVQALNQLDGKPWLSEKQLDGLVRELTIHPGLGLFEVNKKIFTLLTKGHTADNERTGKKNQPVRLIDFGDWAANSFIAINQFLIPTPHGPRQAIIPDIVLFVNGLALVVVECKDEDVAQPLSEALTQINRYANVREDMYSVQEGDERLFYTNLFNVITHGKEARFGTLSADFEFYLNWNDIFPEEYRVVPVSPDECRQEVMIHGLLNREILLDVLRHFTLFMPVSGGQEVKTVCRYQQYRAVRKVTDNMRAGQKGGVVWHTQGSGKSLTMVFLVKKLRSDTQLRGHKVILVVDRADLETQLRETAVLAGEGVTIVESRAELRKLKGTMNNLNLVMLHKFTEDGKVSAQSLIDAGVVPEFKPFEVVNNGDEVLLMVDEAHRSQGGGTGDGMGDNLFTAFPNATRLGFTGTPLLTERHTIKTHERFGPFWDTYAFDKAVRDRATVPLFYIGRTSHDHIDDKALFDARFEDLFKNQSAKEKEEIQKRYGGMEQYLESTERVKKIAADVLEHYVREILPDGLKGMVVASSIVAAVRYSYELETRIKARLADEEAKTEPDANLLEKLRILDVVAVVSSQGNNELGYITQARNKARDRDAVANFKRSFTPDKPETGIGLLCVCDRLLTGFDAPIAKVMYLDKNLREHDLLQAIARVNRTRKGKTAGLLVDYFGVTKHLREALSIYTTKDEKSLAELSEFFRDLNKELPLLETRLKRVLNVFADRGVAQIEDFVYQRMTDKEAEFALAERCIELAQDVKARAEFDTYLKSYFDTLELLFNVKEVAPYWIPTQRLGYLHWRIQNRYKDPTMDLKWASAKVRKLIDTHLQSMGITQEVEQVSILSDDFPQTVLRIAPNSRAIASEMEHAIRFHIKVKLESDPALYSGFNERLERIIKTLSENWEQMRIELEQLRQDMSEGRTQTEPGVSVEAAPFFDFFLKELGETVSDETKEALKPLAEASHQLIAEALALPNFWTRLSEEKKLGGRLDDLLHYSGVPGISERAEFFRSEFLKMKKPKSS